MEEGDHYVEVAPTQDSNHELDDVIDTLSLSDFMIYENINGDAQDLYRSNVPIGFDDDDDDQFEFSSELLINTSVNNNGVVFCGKIIPYKESNIVSPNTHERKKVQKSHKLQRWRLFMKKSKSGKQDSKYDQVPIRKVSILASATKPRWYVLMFGFGSNSNFSAEMHIRDLKKRQTTKTTMMDEKIRSDDAGGRGYSWSLMRLLGCGGGGRRGGGASHHHPKALKNIIQEFGMRSLGQQVDV